MPYKNPKSKRAKKVNRARGARFYTAHRKARIQASTSWYNEKGYERRYGITKEQRDEMFEKQGKVCAICKSPSPKSKTGWHTDHDHATNKVRGILCHSCNTAMGSLQDKVEVLQSMIAYLQFHAVEQRTAHEAGD
jgi:hypothetical protein